MQDCFVYECKNSMLNIHNSDNTIYSHHINNSICFIDILENCSDFINQLNNMNYNILYKHSTESDFFANIKIDNKDIYKNYLKNFFISEKKIYASEFFSVYHIIIVKNFGIEKNVLEIPLFNNYLFKILSYKGFLLTNLTLFLDKTKYINNLLVSFTETELADELLENGEMIITWGMKSYHYFIGFKDDFPSSIMQDKYRTNFYGSYKISENFEELHYIDGIYFEDWINNIEYKKNFIDKISIPKNISKIDGFYYLRLVVYVIDQDFLGNFISPICFLILEEECIERKTNPLLNFSIF